MECKRYFAINPFSGETYVQGALRARGIYIQRWKIRDALQQIDPVNRAVRRRYAIRRCIYNGNKPNHLRQYIDSNDKLIHWRDLSFTAVSMGIAEPSFI